MGAKWNQKPGCCRSQHWIPSVLRVQTWSKTSSKANLSATYS